MTQKWLTMAEAEAYSGYGRKTLISKAMAGPVDLMGE